jgi:hypothetical protein
MDPTAKTILAQFILGLVGIVIVIVAIISGLVVGEVDKALDDAGFKEEIEKRKKELERQKAWKDRLK